MHTRGGERALLCAMQLVGCCPKLNVANAILFVHWQNE